MAGPNENLNFYCFPYKMQTIRCTLDCGTIHLLISNHWVFYTLFWKVWMPDFHLVLYFWEILMLTYNRQHLPFHKLSRVLHSFVLTKVVPEPTHTNPSGSSTLTDLA